MLDKTKNNIRCTAQTLMFALFALCYPTLAHSEHLDTLSGLAVVEDNGILAINGRRIALWGIDMLAPDQQCWQGEEAWPCGEEAMIALKHFLAGRSVECEIQTAADKDTPPLAKCYRFRNSSKTDIAEHLVRQGWALERGATSGGTYYEAEQSAQTNKRGAWAGRFQTAQDWKDGIQKFVGEEDAEQTATENTAE